VSVSVCAGLFGSVSALKCYVCDSSSVTCLEDFFVSLGTSTEDGCVCCAVRCLFFSSLHAVAFHIQGGPKNGATNARPSFCHFLTYLRILFTEIFLSKFAVNWISKIPPHLASCMCCYTTSRNVNVSKTAINDKLQGSVATCLRYGGIVNNQMKKLLLLVCE